MLKEESIHTHLIHSPQVTRQNLAIIDNSLRKQYRFVFPVLLPKDHIWQESLTYLRDHVSDFDSVVVSGSLLEGVPDDYYNRVAEIVTEARKKFIPEMKMNAKAFSQRVVF